MRVNMSERGTVHGAGVIMRDLLDWVITGLILVGLGWASASHAFSLDELSIDYNYYAPTSIHPVMLYHKPHEALALNMNTTLVQPTEWVGFYWDNRIHAVTDVGRYRLIGWQFGLGFDFNFLRIGYQHHSQHIMDADYSVKFPGWHFPVEDSVHLKIYLVGGK